MLDEMPYQRNYLVPQDLHLIVEDVLVNHPGLGFFRNENDATLFTSYLTVVTTSIFYSGQAWRRGRMYLYQASIVLCAIVHAIE